MVPKTVAQGTAQKCAATSESVAREGVGQPTSAGAVAGESTRIASAA